MGMFDGLQGMFALPDDPNQNAAARQGLLALGGAMMSSRGENFLGSLGQGLMAGGQGYQGALAQQQHAALMAAQKQRLDLDNQEAQAKIDEPMQLQKIMSGGLPAPMGSTAGLPRLGAVPALAVGSNAGAPALEAPAPAAQPADLFSTYISYGDRLTQAGRPAQAKAYYDLAEKLRPKLKAQEARTVDGKRVMVNVFEDGTTRQVDGFAPDAEKLSFQNTGGSTVALDPYTGNPVNTIANTQSPDSVASVAAQVRGQNLTAATAAQSNAKAPAGYRWAADGQTLEPIPGGPVTAKTTEQQQKVGDAQSVLGLLDMATPLVSKSTGSYGGAAVDQIARVFGASTEGGETAAQLKAIEGALISKMPKMSGPQSDKDVLLYKQMAGQVGDTTIPAANKLAAMKVIREINERYLAQQQPQVVKSVKELPRKQATGSHPADITNLLTKYGAK
jgi:hypothetical protein